jgi:hypothetical protein
MSQSVPVNEETSPLEIIYQNGDILPRAFRYIIDNNESNFAPYHNFNHMLRVMYYCNKGCIFHKIEGKRKTNVLLAALFHDFNHSQGEESDEVNVKRAIAGVRDFYENNAMNKNSVNIEKVVEIIQATQYPYVIEADDLSLEQAIIRDADLMPTLDPDWLNNIIVGLMKEMKIDNFKTMCEGQVKFHQGIRMCSTWGETMYFKNWKGVFKNLDTLKSIL